MIQSLLEAIPLPAVFIGTDARLLGGNEQAIRLQPNAGDRRAFILVFRQPGFSTAFEECIRTKQTQTTVYLHSDGGHEIRYDVTCSYVDLESTKGVLACFRDVTEVEQAGEIRRDFVANVSHELKTPLTALLGFIETLQGPARNDTAAQERFLTIMGAEASRMNRLVGDLLSLSRVEEEARLRPTNELDVSDIVRTVARNLSEVAKAQNVTITLHGLDSGADLTVLGDPDQLLQVFTNLVENAVKYGGSGGEVSIGFKTVERDLFLRRPAVRIDVTDNGQGIDPLHIPRLTERFYRIDSHRSREMGGTGLGLAIVKHIVNRHRGRLKIDSDLGRGSTFSVILPKN
ncbi:ATP-binding protein [Cognatishimia sp.]|uniref:ATP-binding protein n=1 Tax=Cognatishimia sp. TaxID=2211648 RepID=UPI0035197D8B